MKVYLQLRKMWKIYLIMIIFVIACCGLLQHNVGRAYLNGKLQNGDVSFTDRVFYILGGIAPIKNEEDKYFQLPFIWLGIQMLVLAVGYMEPFGEQTVQTMWQLFHAKSRTYYIVKELFYTLVRVLVLYACIFIGIVMYSMTGNMSVELHREYFILWNQVNITDTIYYLLWLCPILYAMSIVCMQCFLNLCVGKMLAFGILLTYQIIVIYTPSSYVWGNMAMLFRTMQVEQAAIHLEKSILLMVAATLIVIILTIKRFQKSDYL